MSTLGCSSVWRSVRCSAQPWHAPSLSFLQHCSAAALLLPARQLRSVPVTPRKTLNRQPIGRIDLRPQQPYDHLNPSVKDLPPPQYNSSDPKPFTEQPEWRSYNKPRILRPVLFSAAVVGIAFGVGSYMRAQDRWDTAEKRNQRGYLGPITDLFRPQPRHYGDPIPADPISRISGMLKDWYAHTGPAQRAVYAIIGVNAAVFLCWRPLPWRGFMMRHFAHHPMSGRSYTLLTSAFSHEGLLHLGFNMYALVGFAPLLQDRALGSTEQFVAFYMAAAVLASLGSHLVSVLWLNRLRAPRPSLGASGAIWAVLAGCATIFPHLPVGIVFLPGISFTMGDLVPVMVGLDILGLVRGWAMFDHAAHLAGAAVGYLYMTYGRVYWNELQAAWDQAKLESRRQ
ncbi:hypothetical protein HKX48_006266 [Thoreauomyces humboldtii]|nr:hypothetical protein HKX48_006266 [Thoreauomyces humboldtii]